MRLNKYIATAGICSRRKADSYIQDGKVFVNGQVAQAMGMQIDEEKDQVVVDGNEIALQEKKIYLMLNKPKGYVTTNEEQFGRPCTLDLIPKEIRVFPIGRLDMYTEGLLLFTNDGEFANHLMHPKHQVQKTYIVRVNNYISDTILKQLENGVDIGEYVTQKAIVKRVSSRSISITIQEGKNRQIRRMCAAVGIVVANLKRVQIGDLNVGKLPVGEYRYISKEEIKKLI